MKSSVLELDPKRYGRLVARKLPAVIRTEAENERLIAELEELEQRGAYFFSSTPIITEAMTVGPGNRAL